MCFFHVVHLQAAPSDRRTTPSDVKLFSELCDKFLPALIASSQLLVSSTTTECDRRHGYTTARRRSYAESLCQQVYSDLVGLIGCFSNPETRGDSQLCDALAREQAQQEELCDILSRLYDVTQPDEEKVLSQSTMTFTVLVCLCWFICVQCITGVSFSLVVDQIICKERPSVPTGGDRRAVHREDGAAGTLCQAGE